MNTSPLIAEAIHVKERTDAVRLSATLRDGPTTQEVWIDYPTGTRVADVPGNAILAATVMRAMAQHRPLHVAAPVSRRLVDGARAFMRVLHGWLPELAEVALTTEGTAEEPPGSATATFFSGGVDSFYTLLTQEATISHVLFIRGYDLSLERDHRLYATTLAAVRDVAAQLGKTMVPVASNIRLVLAPFVSWDFAHGAALLSVALGLGGLGRVYVPGTHTRRDSFPWGSHPATDPLWSTEALEVIHDGGNEVTRVQKVQRLAESDVALRHLRVCFENRYAAYNCGRCGKCLRTMVNLEVAGALTRCQTFRRPLRLRDVRRLVLRSENERSFMRENYEALAGSGANLPLQQAVAHCLAQRPSWWRGMGPRLAHWLRHAIMAVDARRLGGTVKALSRRWLRT